jgi:hypothetical protein
VGGGVQPVGSPVYDGCRYLWKRERADLSAFTGAQGNAVRLRYRVRSDTGTRLAGLDLDSLRVTLYDPAAQPSPVAVEDGPLPARIALSAPSPSPVRGKARFTFALPVPGAVRLELFDVAGRHVATLAAGTLPAGRYVREWDGRDGAGRVAPAGVYLARLAGDAGQEMQRFAVIH